MGTAEIEDVNSRGGPAHYNISVCCRLDTWTLEFERQPQYFMRAYCIVTFAMLKRTKEIVYQYYTCPWERGRCYSASSRTKKAKPLSQSPRDRSISRQI